MCGILGIATEVPYQNEGLFRTALNLMEHRGPDFGATWWNDQKTIGFGHRRLAILDLDPRSNQPFERQDLGLVIVFNGEIYNHKELKAQLAKEGQEFFTSSDTEVLLVAYKIWGQSMLKQLRGMFAFVIYDQEKQVLFGARDRGGEKPFYYSNFDKGLVFGSEIKSILALPEIEKRVSLQSLDYLLSYGYAPRDGSIVQGIQKLKPGNYLKYQLREAILETGAYWELPDLNMDQKDAVSLTEDLHQLLLSAINEQLEADVPVGVLLSGGVDSSLVTAIAAETGKKIRTFNVGFPQNAAFDESGYARQIADHFGTEHHQLNIGEIQFDLMYQLAEQFDDPIFDASMIPTFLVTKMVKEHCTVALGGDAGDELFGGYRWYNDIQNKAKALRRFPSWISPFAGKALDTFGFKSHPKRYWLESFYSNSQILPFTPGFFSKTERNNLFPELQSLDSRSEDIMMQSVLKGNDFVDRYTRLDFQHYMPDDVLVKVDRSSMMNSLEMRAPFLDSRIVDFAFSKVPSNLKANGDERKILLKSLSKKLLPANYDAGRKQGFGVPVDQWLTSGNWKDEYHSIIGASNHVGFKKTALSEQNGTKRFGLLMLQMWMDKYELTLS